MSAWWPCTRDYFEMGCCFSGEAGDGGGGAASKGGHAGAGALENKSPARRKLLAILYKNPHPVRSILAVVAIISVRDHNINERTHAHTHTRTHARIHIHIHTRARASQRRNAFSPTAAAVTAVISAASAMAMHLAD